MHRVHTTKSRSAANYRNTLNRDNHATGFASCTQRNPFTSFFHSGKYRCVHSQVLAGPHSALYVCPLIWTSVDVHSQISPCFLSFPPSHVDFHSSTVGRRLPAQAQYAAASWNVTRTTGAFSLPAGIRP